MLAVVEYEQALPPRQVGDDQLAQRSTGTILHTKDRGNSLWNCDD